MVYFCSQTDGCVPSHGLWYGEGAHASDLDCSSSFVAMTQNKSFRGMKVAAFESRMATEMARLIEKYGGQAFVAPALREVPIQDNPTALRFGARLIDGQVDVLILMTGIGTTTLFEILRSRHSLESIMAGLEQTAIVAR